MSSKKKQGPVMGHSCRWVQSNMSHVDLNYLEGLPHSNREKLPEGAVHAHGAGAYGEFEVTHDISDICNIDMLLGVGKKTPVITRFSTTGPERGSSEQVQDLKGMATKFFTPQGEWDWMFLNFPCFFIRDPAKLPDLMHSQRRDLRTNRVNPNNFWSFVVENPGSMHMTLLQYSDLGRTSNWRSMSGYAGHAFKWVMPDGSFKYVHFFLSSNQGPKFAAGGATRWDPSDPDFSSRDLYESIERGEYPSWTANVQVIDPKDAPRLGFNILDVSKHWTLGNSPKRLEKIPSRPFGKLVLNRIARDYVTEVEQLAFSVSNMVPGVEASEDPVLQARMFAYPDSQQSRLRNLQERSQMNNRSGLRQDASRYGPDFADGVAQISQETWSLPHADDYKFARGFYEALPELQSQKSQDKMVRRIVESIAQTSEHVYRRLLMEFGVVSAELARRIQEGVEEVAMSRTRASRARAGARL